jgi:hypothetical protein
MDQREARPARDPPPWANPWLWLAVSAVFLVLGIFVWPALFGGVFVFLPLVWLSRPQSSTMDPRANGHEKRDGGGSLR